MAANPAMTASEYEALRSGIESEFNGLRDAIEKTYETAQRNLENQFHADIHDNRVAKEQAMLDAGLNPDGSDPQGRQQGSTI